MRPEENPLDLNNLPNDSSRDGRRAFEEGSSSGSSEKQSGSKDGKEYECRFCSLKFCKSQALGGHMNRHRQERETESLNKARELVLRNDSFPAQGPSSLCYHPAGHIGDATLYRPTYAPRLFSAAATSSTLPPPLPPPPLSPQPYIYTPTSFPLPPYPVNEYYLGQALGDHHKNSGELRLCPRHRILNYMTAASAGGASGSSPAEQSYIFTSAPLGTGGSAPSPSAVNRIQDNEF